MEADREQGEFRRRVASFSYDITPLPVKFQNGVLQVDSDEGAYAFVFSSSFFL
jgi:hypothetical protein